MFWPARVTASRLRPFNAATITRTSVVVALFALFLCGDGEGRGGVAVSRAWAVAQSPGARLPGGLRHAFLVSHDRGDRSVLQRSGSRHVSRRAAVEDASRHRAVGEDVRAERHDDLYLHRAAVHRLRA